MFQTCKIEPKLSSHPVEVLLNNRLEKEVYSIIYPFNYMLTPVFSSKFNSQDNYITPNGKTYHVLMFISVLLVNAMCLYRLVSGGAGNELFIDDNIIILFINLSYYMYYSFGFTMIFILTVAHTHSNIVLVLRIQMIHKSIDFSKSIRNFIIWNWILLLIVISINIIMFVMYYSLSDYLNFVDFTFDLFSDLMFTTFDINFVYAIRLITLLRKYLEEWIKQIMTINDEQENDKYCMKLFAV